MSDSLFFILQAEQWKGTEPDDAALKASKFKPAHFLWNQEPQLLLHCMVGLFFLEADTSSSQTGQRNVLLALVTLLVIMIHTSALV